MLEMPSRKMISLTEKTYKDLVRLGTLEDSFDSVISRMIEKEKAATSGPTLAGTNQNAATVLQPSTTRRQS
jgi:predicted CopG family antitoxin